MQIPDPVEATPIAPNVRAAADAVADAIDTGCSITEVRASVEKLRGDIDLDVTREANL